MIQVLGSNVPDIGTIVGEPVTLMGKVIAIESFIRFRYLVRRAFGGSFERVL